jgi:hypothetical protein
VPLCLCPPPPRLTHQTSHSTADPSPHTRTLLHPRQAQLQPSSPPAEQQRNALRTLSWPTGIPTAASQHKSAQQAQKRELSGDGLRLIRHRARAPSTAAFNLSPRTSPSALASTTDTPTRPHPRAHIHLSSTIASPSSTAARRPQLSSPAARASTRVICARIVQTSSRASASTPAQTFALRKPQAPPTLKATAAGRAQRHRRVNSDTRDRTNRLPEHCRATRKTPVKSRRDGMLVVLPATIYTCNGVWYNQPSSTERFRYVPLPARIMRRRRPLRRFRRVSSYCDSC